jgi:hypothetical protein
MISAEDSVLIFDHLGENLLGVRPPRCHNFGSTANERVAGTEKTEKMPSSSFCHSDR